MGLFLRFDLEGSHGIPPLHPFEYGLCNKFPALVEHEVVGGVGEFPQIGLPAPGGAAIFGSADQPVPQGAQQEHGWSVGQRFPGAVEEQVQVGPEGLRAEALLPGGQGRFGEALVVHGPAHGPGIREDPQDVEAAQSDQEGQGGQAEGAPTGSADAAVRQGGQQDDPGQGPQQGGLPGQQPAQGMPYQHGRHGQQVQGVEESPSVVLQTEAVTEAVPVPAMSGQVQGIAAKAPGQEPGDEALLPAPAPVHDPVYEQQRRSGRGFGGIGTQPDGKCGRVRHGSAAFAGQDGGEGDAVLLRGQGVELRSLRPGRDIGFQQIGLVGPGQQQGVHRVGSPLHCFAAALFPESLPAGGQLFGHGGFHLLLRAGFLGGAGGQGGNKVDQDDGPHCFSLSLAISARRTCSRESMR